MSICAPGNRTSKCADLKLSAQFADKIENKQMWPSGRCHHTIHPSSVVRRIWHMICVESMIFVLQHCIKISTHPCACMCVRMCFTFRVHPFRALTTILTPRTTRTLADCVALVDAEAAFASNLKFFFRLQSQHTRAPLLRPKIGHHTHTHTRHTLGPDIKDTSRIPVPGLIRYYTLN